MCVCVCVRVCVCVLYTCVFIRRGNITFIKAKCYERTSEQGKENGGCGFARNSKSEKNERNNEVILKRMYKYVSENGFHKRKKGKKNR